MTRASRPDASTVISLAVGVLGADAHVDRALDVDVDAGQAQAALLHDVLIAGGPLEDGVHERLDGPVVLDAVDEQAREAADLGRGEADAERVVHEAAHLLDLGPQGVVEDLDAARLGAQDGVAVLAHVGERRLAPRPGLGVERRRAGLDLADLVDLVATSGDCCTSAMAPF